MRKIFIMAQSLWWEYIYSSNLLIVMSLGGDNIRLLTHVLHQLHWLPIQYHIQFKTQLLTFKAIHNLAPPYLTDLLHIHTPSRSLRSSSSISLSVPPARLTTMGSRAFSRSAPCLQNSLPPDIWNIQSLDTFKFNLKTYLFKQAHHC